MSDEEDAVSGGQEGAEARAQGRLSRGGKEAGGGQGGTEDEAPGD